MIIVQYEVYTNYNFAPPVKFH